MDDLVRLGVEDVRVAGPVARRESALDLRDRRDAELLRRGDGRVEAQDLDVDDARDALRGGGRARGVGADGAGAVRSYRVEWDTSPPVREVQTVRTEDTSSEVQTISADADCAVERQTV